MPVIETSPVAIPADRASLDGDFEHADEVRAVVAVGHATADQRLSPRSHRLTDVLRRAGFATLVFDLLTTEERRTHERDTAYRRHVDFLARRMLSAMDWLRQEPRTRGLPIGLVSTDTGAAAAIRVGAAVPESVSAIVSIEGRLDLAGAALAQLQAPLLILVGDDTRRLQAINAQAGAVVRSPMRIEAVGRRGDVAPVAREWLVRHLLPSRD